MHFYYGICEDYNKLDALDYDNIELEYNNI